LTNRRHIEQEHENHERWLISYADMVTLLFALFVLLFAISQINQKKFDELAVSLATGFGTVVNISDGNDSILPEAGDNVTLNSTPPVDVPAIVVPDIMPQLKEQVSAAMSTQGTIAGEKTSLAVQAAESAQAADQANLSKAELALVEAVSASSLAGKVLLSREERGLVVTLLTDDVIFAPHSATLQSGGEDAIRALLPALQDSGTQLIIEGHTNTANVQPINFASDWELSSSRAGAVARFLNSEGGVSRDRMHVAGYADTSPLVPETNPDHLRLNRRVAIVLASGLTDEQRALLAGSRVAGAIADMQAAQ
jgi:chemotaxis protein MotB